MNKNRWWSRHGPWLANPLPQPLIHSASSWWVNLHVICCPGRNEIISGSVFTRSDCCLTPFLLTSSAWGAETLCDFPNARDTLAPPCSSPSIHPTGVTGNIRNPGDIRNSWSLVNEPEVKWIVGESAAKLRKVLLSLNIEINSCSWWAE